MKNNKLWIQITSGQGPEECCLAVRKLFNHIFKQALNNNITTEILDFTSSRKKENYESILLELLSKNANIENFIDPYIGTIKWICESPYRPKHKRKNWFIAINILPSISVNEIAIQAEDIIWKAIKASGPGGQHVNTTNSAIQALHKPSGIKIFCKSERSQHMNKKIVIDKIKAVLLAQEQLNKTTHHQQQWNFHKKLERGNPVKIFKGEIFKEC